jgi:stage II sporulation protein M
MALRWLQKEKENLHYYVFVGVLLLVGTVFGMMLVRSLSFAQQQDLADRLGFFLQTYQQADASASTVSFAERAGFYAKWLVLIWAFGLSIIGLPLVLALVFLKGVLLGFAVGLLVQSLAWDGLLLFLAAVAPQNVLVVPAIAIAGVSSLRYAFIIVREKVRNRKPRWRTPLAAHTAISGLMMMMLVCAALFEAYVTPLLLENIVPMLAVSPDSAPQG